MFLETYSFEGLHFIEEENKVTAISNNSRIVKLSAIAQCNGDDVYNTHIGKAIALGRLLDVDVSIFIYAPQPKKNVVGQIITFPKGDEFHRKVTYNVDRVDTRQGNLTILKDDVQRSGTDSLVGHKANANLKVKNSLVTIDDTYAKY